MKDNTIFPIIFTVALSIGIALFAYFLLTHFTVDPSLQDNERVEYYRENNLLNFYEQSHDGDIFILGSSHVTEGIDAYIIEDSLKKQNINRSVYNLGIHGDTPLGRVCEVDNIIASRPKMVVIGLSYRDFMGSGTLDTIFDHQVICFQRKQINERKQIQDDFQPIFNDDRLQRLNSFERFFDNRKFLISKAKQIFVFNRNTSSEERILVRDQTDFYMSNFKDPWVYGINISEEGKIKILNNDKTDYLVSEDLNPQKKALLYIINKISNNNIGLIIINMPIDPLFSDKILTQNELLQQHNLLNFLNSTGVLWYDYEREYPSDYFFDDNHLNAVGRKDFSSKMATILADNLIKGA